MECIDYFVEVEREKGEAKVRMLRIERGMTQQELSNVSGIYIRQIQKLEAGDILPSNMSLENALNLADALGVPPRELL
jgi:transcriptional regulator with XRE-family HTH domain